MTETFQNSIDRYLEQVKSGKNLAEAYFNSGKYYMLSGEQLKSLLAYTCAIRNTTDHSEARDALDALLSLKPEIELQHGYNLTLDILRLGLVAKFKDEDALVKLKKRVSRDCRSLDNSVVILLGPSDHKADKQIPKYRDFVVEGFKDYFGTVISSGTDKGVGSLAGDIQLAYPTRVYSVGYIPATLPALMRKDKRYSEFRTTEGSDYSPLQPIQYWTDILTAGVKTSSVKVLILGENEISNFELSLAIALGATAVTIDSYREELTRQGENPLFMNLESVSVLPEEQYVLRGFIGTGIPSFPEPMLGIIAKALHETYRTMNSHHRTDESMAEWDELSEALKDSNYLAVDHLAQKLNEAGFVMEHKEGADINVVNFNHEELEIIAEMEHARWISERMVMGWIPGAEKDIKMKTDPGLTAWDKLDDETKEIDRALVRKLPQFLSHFDIEVRKK